MSNASQTSKEMRDKFESNQKSVLGQDDSNWQARMQLMTMASKSPAFAAGAFLGRALRPQVNAWLDELFDRPVKSNTSTNPVTTNPVTSNPEAFNNAWQQHYAAQYGGGEFSPKAETPSWDRRKIMQEAFGGNGTFNGGY